MNIERKAADTILQNNLGSITIEGIEYEIEPPTTATLIMVSALIGELPDIEVDPEGKDFIAVVLGAARESESLGQIAATLVLGAKRIKEHPLTTIDIYEIKKRWSWRKFRKQSRAEKKPVQVYERDYLAEKILTGMTAKELHEFVGDILTEAHLADFFVLTTSLKEKSLLTPKREVEKTTASGLS